LRGGFLHGALGLQGVEGAVEKLVGRGVASGGEFCLDAGFRGGAEDEAHGRKYNAGAGDGEPVRAASGGVRDPRECGGNAHLLIGGRRSGMWRGQRG